MKKILILLIITFVSITACTTNGASSKNEITKSYSITEVAAHDSISDCWMVIDSGVYDVTDYVNSHPGGSVIAEGCGIDATRLFNSEGSHGSKANLQRDALQVGILN